MNKIKVFLLMSLFTSLSASAGILSTETTSDGVKSRPSIILSGPLAVIDDVVFWGPSLTLSQELTQNFSVLFQSGYLSGSDSYSTGASGVYSSYANSKAKIIPLLLGATYKLRTGRAISPYFGIVSGVSIIDSDAYYQYSAPGSFNDSYSYSGTDVEFTAMGKIGATIGTSEMFGIDVQAGILDGAFAIAPSLQVIF